MNSLLVVVGLIDLKLHNVAVTGESASANIEVADACKETFAKIVGENSYTPQ